MARIIFSMQQLAQIVGDHIRDEGAELQPDQPVTFRVTKDGKSIEAYVDLPDARPRKQPINPYRKMSS